MNFSYMILTNFAKRLHNFLKFIKDGKQNIAEYLLIATSLSFWKGIHKIILVEKIKKKEKKKQKKSFFE